VLEVTMSHSFERQLDLLLDTRAERRYQKQADTAATEAAIHSGHAKLEQIQAQFCDEIRPLIEQAVARANRHLANRSERCQLCEISGYFTGPLYPGGSACNPIAFELRVDGAEVGEPLIVELTHDGMIEAFLGPYRPCEPGAHTTRLSLRWRPVPLGKFNAEMASELVLRYVTAVTAAWPLGREPARSQVHQ
jgi:hypothetical protein